MENQDSALPTLAPRARDTFVPRSLAVAQSKRSRTACLACKRAKRKCSGPPTPCKMCQETNSECIIDETLDLRRKIATKRTIEELEYHKNLLLFLIEFLCRSEPKKIEELLLLIRADTSLDAIAAVVGEHPLGNRLDEAPDLESQDDSGLGGSEISPRQLPRQESSLPQGFLPLERLCDIPLFDVAAKPWTAITSDSQLISHLVSLYFIWEHPFFQIIDQRLFLKHMSAGQLDSLFCSPFLVNSLLAVASMHSEYPEVLAMPGDASSRGQRFFQEAERLWKAEEGAATLTNIQGLTMMSIVLDLQGKHSSSWMLFRQAVQLSKDLELFPPQSLHPARQDASADVLRAREITAWGIFILNSQVTVSLKKSPDLEIPLIERHTIREDSGSGDTWAPYPHLNQDHETKSAALLQPLMASLCDLTVITTTIQKRVLATASETDIGELWRVVNTMLAQLQHWHANLPATLSVHGQPVPHVLLLRVQYHSVVMKLFGAVAEHHRPLLTISPSLIEQARLVQIQSAKEIAQYCRIYRLLYGLSQLPRQMLHPVSNALGILSTDLQSGDSRGAFIELSQFLFAFAKRFRCVFSMVKWLEEEVHEFRHHVPIEVMTIFETLGRDPLKSP